MPVNQTLKWLVTRAAQLLALVACGIAAALVIGLYVEYETSPWVPSGRWIALGVYTVFVFGTSIYDFRPAWQRSSFWVSVVGFLFVHGILYGIGLSAVGEWRTIWFLPISIVELIAIETIVHSIGFGDVPTVSQRLGSTKLRDFN